MVYVDTPNLSRHCAERDIGFLLGCAALFLVVSALYFIVPLGLEFSTRQLGSSIWAPDNVLTAGILEWGYHALWSPNHEVFNWPAGYPVSHSLAGTENLIGWQVLYSPMRRAGITPVLAFNILVLLSLVVSGIGASALARSLGLTRSAAFLTGLAFAFAPIHIFSIIQIQTLAVCWLPIELLCFDRYYTQPTLRNGVGFGLVLLVVALSCIYMAIFFAILLPAWALSGFCFRKYELSFAAVIRVVSVALCVIILTCPVWKEYVVFSKTYGFEHSREEIITRSASVLDFVQAPAWLSGWGHTWLRQQAGHRGLFPGICLIALIAMTFLGFNSLNRHQRSTVASITFMAALCIALSFGPVLKFGSEPMQIFRHRVPGPGALLLFVPGVRVPYRFLVCASLFAAIVAGFGFSLILVRFCKNSRTVFAITIMLMIIDVWPNPLTMRRAERLPLPADISDAYKYLAMRSETGAIIELPTAMPDGYQPTVQARYVYGMTGHLHHTVSYHASVLPLEIKSLQESANRLPNCRSRQHLLQAGVTRVIVHRTNMSPVTFESDTANFDAAGYQREFTGREAVIYNLLAPTQTCPS